MKPLLIALLLACTCSAAIVVDQSQAWYTNGIGFHWIWQTDYGYEPIDLQGRIVSGLTDGAIVWLVDDSSSGSGLCCETQSPPAPPAPPAPPTPPVAVTPEPGTWLMMGAGLLALTTLSRQHRIFLSPILLFTCALFPARARSVPQSPCAILKEGEELGPAL